MVQLPESCDENSEAFKAGYKTIAEISKESIRRAGKKILEGKCHEGWNNAEPVQYELVQGNGKRYCGLAQKTG